MENKNEKRQNLEKKETPDVYHVEAATLSKEHCSYEILIN